MVKRGLLVLTVLAGLLSTSLVDAGAAPRAVARFHHSTQDLDTARLRVVGYAFNPASPAASITVKIYANGHYLHHVRAALGSAAFNRIHHITGRHAFAVTLRYRATVRAVTIVPVGSSTPIATLAPKHIRTIGPRIIAFAKKYVGKVRYRDGGASPRSGFDCSGYTMYVYAKAHAPTLPHNAERQRHNKHLRSVSARSALAGDLVFYMSGGYAFHVAIYAGHGKQYSAATPRDGIRYQRLWSTHVKYRTFRP